MEPSNMSINWIIPSEINLKKCERKFGKFVIRVLNEDEKSEAMVLIREALFVSRDDPRVSALKFDETSTNSLDRWIMLHFNQNIVYGCFLKVKKFEQGKSVIKFKLVAVDALYVRDKRDTFPEPSKESGEAFGSLMKCIKKIEQHLWSVGETKKYNTQNTNILTSFGVFTSEEFKNRGITKQMIKTR